MNIRDIRYFLKVYEEKSINIAAEKLFITPQGLSTVITKLERELNCTLFNRNRAGSIPTECGEVFYRFGTKLIEDYSNMSAEISLLTRQQKDSLKFGYSYGAMTGLSLELTMAFHELHPEYSLEYQELPDGIIEEMVERGELDIGFASCSKPDGFNATFMHESEILFVPRRDSALFDREIVSIYETADEPITMRDESFATTIIMMNEYKKCGKIPVVILNTGGILRSLSMCKENKANTIILNNVLAQLNDNSIRTIPFREHPKWTLYMFSKKGRRQSKALIDFSDFCMEKLGHNN